MEYEKYKNKILDITDNVFILIVSGIFGFVDPPHLKFEFISKWLEKERCLKTIKQLILQTKCIDNIPLDDIVDIVHRLLITVTAEKQKKYPPKPWKRKVS